jgi:hypothetical protein
MVKRVMIVFQGELADVSDQASNLRFLYSVEISGLREIELSWGRA